MSRNVRSSHSISGLFVFLLLGLFAVFSTVMVVLGARAYRNMTQAQALHNAERIAPAYLRSMVRSVDGAGSLRVERGDGSDLLIIEQTFDDEPVITYIYCDNGVLRENFMTADLEFVPSEGETVCALDSIRLDLRDGLLHVSLVNGDDTTEMNIALYAAT